MNAPLAITMTIKLFSKKVLLNVQVNAIHIDIIAKILIFGHRKVNYIKYYKDIKKKLTG